MHRLIFVAAAFALVACGQQQAGDAPQAACARTATHEVAWTSSETPDTITARAEGPTCAQAVVTLVARNAAGDPLWAFASTYYDMTMGGVPPGGAPAVSDEQMDTFLAGWANVSLSRTTDLPEWTADAETLSAAAQTFSYDTPFDRETYEMLRTRDLPMVCYAAAVEGSQCMIIDPPTNAAIKFVAYGP